MVEETLPSLFFKRKILVIKIILVSEKYINYLFKFDNNVRYNKGESRPYIGILLEVNGNKYYAPLSSPKPKFLKMKNCEDFMRIDSGKLGAINFNNMIPLVDSAIIDILKELGLSSFLCLASTSPTHYYQQKSKKI